MEGGGRPRPAPRAKKTQDTSTSVLLLNMIRSMTKSSSDDQKEIDRHRLETGFAESTRLTDKLLKEHENDIETCLESFKNVSTRITACRERVRSVKTGLMSCRSLLQCRRDDLKRLWMENAQQRHISTVLSQIEELKHIESEVDEEILKADYLAAANFLKNADLLLNGPFSNIDGLSCLRTSVHQASKKLVDHIVEDFTALLIVQPFENQLLEIIKTLPDGKVSASVECNAILARFSSDDQSEGKRTRLATFQNNSQKILSSHLARSIQALCVLNQLNTTLSSLIQLTPATLLRQAYLSAAVVCLAFNDSGKGDAEHLAQYLHLVLNQLKCSADAHRSMDEELNKIKPDDIIDEEGPRIFLYANFWEMAQQVVEKVVVDYVQVNAISSANMSTKSSGEKYSLFKFSSSACAATTVTNQSSKQLRSLICDPSPWNITTLYPQLERFCCEREAEFGKKPCRLRRFLHSFIVDEFIDRFKNKLELDAEQALQNRDAWRILAHYSNPKVLSSCYDMYLVCEEIGKLIETMEPYAERLSALWLLVIDEFTKSAAFVYEKILRSNDGEEKDYRKISAAWAVDEDISRLLKSLPNWFMVNAPKTIQTPSVITPVTLSPTNESENDVRMRNERESEILIGNLGTAKQLSRNELITDIELIRSLACMHESLKWFCMKMHSLIKTLPESCRTLMSKCIIHIQMQNSAQGADSKVNIYSAVEQRLTELDSMADTCLLIIHLELRVHCFFHLLPLAQARSSLPHDELDVEVVDLGRDLTQFHQVLNTCLPPQKMKYIFDGLGHLSASIFIHSSQHMQKLTENGKKRVCRNIFGVQQRLSHLTGRRESELERARTFFELLNHDPDQLLALILERGAVFSHLEYTYLLSLAIRCHPILSSQPGALEQRISQLKHVLSQLKKH